MAGVKQMYPLSTEDWMTARNGVNPIILLEQLWRY